MELHDKDSVANDKHWFHLLKVLCN